MLGRLIFSIMIKAEMNPAITEIIAPMKDIFRLFIHSSSNNYFWKLDIIKINKNSMKSKEDFFASQNFYLAFWEYSS